MSPRIALPLGPCRMQNNGSSEDVCILVPRIYEYVTLHEKRYFTNINKDIDLEMERISWIIQVDPI